MADYISREAAIRVHCDGCVDDGYCGKLDGRYACEDVPQIMAIPAADVRPVVRGEWLAYAILDDMCYQHYSCSVCKRVEAIPHGYDVKKELPFCHCGADMREEGSDG